MATATVRLVPIEEAQVLRTPRTIGVRRERMNQFDKLIAALIDNPDQGAVYEEIDENPQKFVLSLRGAFRRAGVEATVRKLRGRDEVRAWIVKRPEPARAHRSRAAGRNGRTPELAGVH